MKLLRRAAAFLMVGGCLYPQTAQQQVERMRQQLQRGETAAVIAQSTAAIAASPKEGELYHLRGLAYFRQGDLKAADLDLHTAHQLEPKDADISFDAGLLQMAQRHYTEAAARFEGAMKDPALAQRALAHIMLGRAYQNSNRSELAVREFRQALRLDERVQLGHFHLGFAFASMGKDEDALREYEKELAVTRENPEVFYQYGETLSETGRCAQALAPLRSAINLQPDNADALYVLGKCLLGTEQAKEAIAVLQRSAQLKPDAPDVHYQLARAWKSQGDAASAAAEMKIFQTLKSKQPDAGGMATGLVR